MSLLMVRKSAPAHAADSAKDAQDANGDEVIAQKNGYKLVHNTLNDGYWFYTKSGAGWGLTATNKVAAVNEFNRLVDSAKDSAADAKDSARNVKYRGCEITVAYHDPDNVNLSGKTWIVKDVDGVSVGGFSSEAKAKAWIDAHPSRAADSNAEEIVNHDRIPVDQLGGEANARKHGYIIAKKGGRVYGVHIDGYSDKLAKKTIEEAGYTVVGDADADSAQDAYIAFPTPPANGKPFPQEARIIEKLKKEMMDFASHVEDAARHFDFVANVNKSGNTLEEQELYDFYRAWEHKCDSIRSALH